MSEGARAERLDAKPALGVREALLSSRATLFFVLLLAAAVRLPGVLEGLPFSYYGDELHLVKRSMAMGGGDLNPHWFHKPALLMYLLLFCYGLYFLAGRLVGAFESVEAFGAHFLADMGPFLLIGRLLVFAFGLATVWVVWRLALAAYGRIAAAASAAVFAAVLLPMVLASQTVKEDGPAGFFIAASVLLFLRTWSDRRLWLLAAAAALAGLAMATKYYGLLLLPTFFLAELFRLLGPRRELGDALLRGGAILAAFVGAFFVASPYNFLDPMWGESIYQHLQESLTVRADKVAYDADSGVRFERGLVSVPGAFAHLVSKLTHPEAFGLPLTLMAGLGLLLGLLRRETRWATFVLGAPVATFALLAALLAPYHVNPRHFNAVFGLLCPLAAGGVLLSAQALTTRRVALWAGLATGLLAAAVAARSAVMLAPQFRDDTRTLAYFWILQNLPRDARILVEDYGPILQPNERAIARLEARLAELPQDEAFTRHQSMRLSLLRRHPPAHRFDVVELGHAWWVAQETPDEELRASPYHRDMGNPLIHRTPKTLAEYRAEGVRYVVVNSMGMERYQEKGLEASFPSVMRFYAELRALEPIRVFDPEALDAKGPTIWIYDLAQPRERTR